MATQTQSPLPFADAPSLPTRPLTYDEFLEMFGDGTFAEWVDGKVEFMSPVSLPHTDIALFLSYLLRDYAELHGGGRVLTAPFQMKLSQVRRGREPDLMFVAKGETARLTHTYLDGPATVAVEIISPESRTRDRETKYAEYEQEGVQEYWLLDPELKTADFFVLGAQGKYERQELDADGVFHSPALPGFWMNTHWFWQDPLPTGRQVRAEWGIV